MVNAFRVNQHLNIHHVMYHKQLVTYFIQKNYKIFYMSVLPRIIKFWKSQVGTLFEGGLFMGVAVVNEFRPEGGKFYLTYFLI